MFGGGAKPIGGGALAPQTSMVATALLPYYIELG